jgi:prepilin-type processing-associated H-X9-DG protein
MLGVASVEARVMNNEHISTLRTKSATHLRTIGASLMGFYMEKGRPARGFDELVEWLGSPAMFKSPLPGVRYVRTPQVFLECGPDRILAFEDGATEFVNVLWGDGHVEALASEEAARLIQVSGGAADEA